MDNPTYEELQTLNARQFRRIYYLTYLALGCSKHPSYRAKRKVERDCIRCNEMWAASQALAKMATERQETGQQATSAYRD